MNLIKINLLPYRELREMKQKKTFQGILGVGFVVGLALCAGAYMALDKAIEHQNSRNQALQEGINGLKKEIETIQTLRADKERYLARKKKVEELDNKRFDGARIVDSLNQVVPDGSYLVSLKGKGTDGNGAAEEKEYIIEGRALSDNKVALLMAALPSTGMFDLPELVEIAQTEDAQKFVLRSMLADQALLPPPSVAPQSAVPAQGAEQASAPVSASQSEAK
ncbi:PilN domain-containing protein [Conchiformibius kuhniae]|uniref:PilN domain-containing protein n=1 Tax=Conchiformibius kuhniae TaxID=211502 RepID=A0A8T9MV75_9NEIS|nr:PilN domain-containing protein [Conchiformibius kuhniae]